MNKEMEAKELRIGNILVYPEYMMQLIVESIDSENVNINYSISDCEPIPLTEEWLIKLGAIKSHTVIDIVLYKLDDYYIAIRKEGFRFMKKSTNTGAYEPFKDVSYIHQLQNLYFALTGEEIVQN